MRHSTDVSVPIDLLAITALYIALVSRSGYNGLSETGQMLIWFIAAPAVSFISYGAIYVAVVFVYSALQEWRRDE